MYLESNRKVYSIYEFGIEALFIDMVVEVML